VDRPPVTLEGFRRALPCVLGAAGRLQLSMVATGPCVGSGRVSPALILRAPAHRATGCHPRTGAGRSLAHLRVGRTCRAGTRKDGRSRVRPRRTKCSGSSELSGVRDGNRSSVVGALDSGGLANRSFVADAGSTRMDQLPPQWAEPGRGALPYLRASVHLRSRRSVRSGDPV
jgi:hypothetical protein